jgi:hypothetical protein
LRFAALPAQRGKIKVMLVPDIAAPRNMIPSASKAGKIAAIP